MKEIIPPPPIVRNDVAAVQALSQKNVALPNVEPMDQAAPPPVDTTAPLFKPVVAEGG